VRSVWNVLATMIVMGAMLSMAGCTQFLGDAGNTVKSTNAADYYHKLNLSQESLTRLSASYNAKSGVMMNQSDFRDWLTIDRNLTLDFLAHGNESIEAGQAYLKYLQPGSDEYSQIISDENNTTSNIHSAKGRYNNAVDSYNHWWGAGEFEDL